MTDHETTKRSPGLFATLGLFLGKEYGVSPFAVPPQLVLPASPVSLFPWLLGPVVPSRGGGDTKIPAPPSPSGKPLLLLSVAVRRGGSGSRPAHAPFAAGGSERTKGESGGKAGEGCRRTVRGDRHVYTLHVVPPVIHGVPEPLEHAVVARLTLRNLHQNGLVAGVDLPELF